MDRATADNAEAIAHNPRVILLEAAPVPTAPWPTAPMILVIDGERHATGQPGDMTAKPINGQVLLRTPEGHYRGVRSRLVKQSRGDQIRKWIDLAAVEDKALRDLAEITANGPLAALDGAISDVLTSAEMVKDGRYLQ
nr:MAG TPA: hypothetical protein [Caudoviricetes sp.]